MKANPTVFPGPNSWRAAPRHATLSGRVGRRTEVGKPRWNQGMSSLSGVGSAVWPSPGTPPGRARRSWSWRGAERAGGCLDSRRTASGYWYELGAHACYNSYAGLLEIIEGGGLRDRIVPRGDARKRFAFLRDGAIDMLGPISVLWRFDKMELLRNALRGLRAPKEGATTAGWYGGVVGKRNYSRILAPFLSAVPSQNVDAFPVAGPGSLFKKRERRKDVVKSFTLDGGLGAVATAVAAQPGIEVVTRAVVREARRTCRRLEVRLLDGRVFEAPVLSLAVPPAMASALLRTDFPELAAELARVRDGGHRLDGRGGPARPAEAARDGVPVPADDVFWSAVTRDPVPRPRSSGPCVPLQDRQDRRGEAHAASPGSSASALRLRGGVAADDAPALAGARPRPGRDRARPHAGGAAPRPDRELLRGARHRGLRAAVPRRVGADRVAGLASRAPPAPKPAREEPGQAAGQGPGTPAPRGRHEDGVVAGDGAEHLGEPRQVDGPGHRRARCPAACG